MRISVACVITFEALKCQGKIFPEICFFEKCTRCRRKCEERKKGKKEGQRRRIEAIEIKRRKKSQCHILLLIGDLLYWLQCCSYKQQLHPWKTLIKLNVLNDITCKQITTYTHTPFYKHLRNYLFVFSQWRNVQMCVGCPPPMSVSLEFTYSWYTQSFICFARGNRKRRSTTPELDF